MVFLGSIPIFDADWTFFLKVPCRFLEVFLSLEIAISEPLILLVWQIEIFQVSTLSLTLQTLLKERFLLGRPYHAMRSYCQSRCPSLSWISTCQTLQSIAWFYSVTGWIYLIFSSQVSLVVIHHLSASSLQTPPTSFPSLISSASSCVVASAAESCSRRHSLLNGARSCVGGRSLELCYWYLTGCLRPLRDYWDRKSLIPCWYVVRL